MKLISAIVSATTVVIAVFIVYSTANARMNKECDATLEAATHPNETITIVEKCLKIAPNDEQYAVMASTAFFELEQYSRAAVYANTSMAMATENNKRNDVHESRWMGFGMFMMMQSRFQQFLEADNPSDVNWKHVYHVADLAREYAGCPEYKTSGWRADMDPMLDKNTRIGICVEAIAIQSAASWFRDDYKKACPKAEYLASTLKSQYSFMSNINIKPILSECRDRIKKDVI